MKSATTVDQQLDLLKSRGLTVANIDKAREILLDIGYYRLGFYLFPFEKSYPDLRDRTHEYIDGATFEDAVNLYYFDFDLRQLLMRYLSRIEIAFRKKFCHINKKHYLCIITVPLETLVAPICTIKKRKAEATT